MTAVETIKELKEFLQWSVEEQDNAPHVYVEVADVLEILDKCDEKAL